MMLLLTGEGLPREKYNCILIFKKKINIGEKILSFHIILQLPKEVFDYEKYNPFMDSYYCDDGGSCT